LENVLVNGLTLLVLLALAIGIFVAYRTGRVHGRRDAVMPVPLREVAHPAAPSAPLPDPKTPLPPAQDRGDTDGDVAAEKARLLRSLFVETDLLRRGMVAGDAQRLQLGEFADDRRLLLGDIAQARAETARYRELVVDLENNALPPLLTGPNAFDDLKLVVGIGPVLERMLHRLGVTTYRQIARWSERDIDEFDARLPEFPGRIRRDGWVTQARALHQSKYGATPSPR
jgi:predicted flap endonuclease-1-like 5' DNA nuclease